ncbi:hypothetical protein BU25DRAFT_483159, partial [Macroventuria anomochaeta]
MWPTNRSGVLECEKVAQDAFSFAVSTHLATCNDSSNILRPPSQQQYLKDLIPLNSEPVAPPAPGTACGICLESFADVASNCCMHPRCRGKAIVSLQPCRHFFHYCCIARWHHSARPERNTCPNCRRELFIADSLKAEQIRQLTGDAQFQSREEAVAQLQPNEVLVPWEAVAMRAYAEEGVDRVIEWVRKSRRRRLWGHPWIRLCTAIRDTVLARGGSLRSIFEPHKDTFILLYHAFVVLFQIARHPIAMRKPAFRRFLRWVEDLLEALGRGQFDMLCDEVHHNGLFETDGYIMAVVNNTYLQRQDELGGRIDTIVAEMETLERSQLWNKIVRSLARTGLPS